MAKIENDLNRFGEDITDYSRYLERVNNALTEVEKSMQALNGSYSGGAHDALEQHFAEDANNVRKMLTELKKYLSDLHFADNAYDTCENQVRSLIGRI